MQSDGRDPVGVPYFFVLRLFFVDFLTRKVKISDFWISYGVNDFDHIIV